MLGVHDSKSIFITKNYAKFVADLLMHRDFLEGRLILARWNI